MKTTNRFCERLVHVALVAAIGYLLSAAGGPAAAQCDVDCDKTKCSTRLDDDAKDKFFVYENDCYRYWNTKTKNNQIPDKFGAENQYKDATGKRDCPAVTKSLAPPQTALYHGIAVECTGVGDWIPTVCHDKCKNKS